MRAMVWILLVLNGLVAVAWLSGVAVPAAATEEQSLRGDTAVPLRLLSELPHAPRLLDRSLPAVAQSGEPVSVGSDGAAPPVAQAAETPEITEAAGLAEASEAVVAPVSDEPIVAPVSGPAQQAMAEVPGSEADPPAVGAPPGGAGPGEPVCYRTADLAGDAYQAAGERLRAAGFDALDLQPQNRARPRYWVYWSGTVDQVGAVEARLKTAGIDDWYRMRVPGRQARVALGVYGNKEGARRRQRALAGQGVQAQVEERYAAQASLRWVWRALPARVEAVEADLAGQGVRLERCS